MKTKKHHIEAVESYANGNISELRGYLRALNSVELLECLEVFLDYDYSIKKMIWLLA